LIKKLYINIIKILLYPISAPTRYPKTSEMQPRKNKKERKEKQRSRPHHGIEPLTTLAP
jgi:hypothetical protein